MSSRVAAAAALALAAPCCLAPGFLLPATDRGATTAQLRGGAAGGSPALGDERLASGASAAVVVGTGAALAVAGAALRASRRAAKASAVGRRAFENELGVQSPTGFWDPAGFCADGSVASFRRRRSVELKHGRISMLACMGYMTPEISGKFPGYLSPSLGLKFADIPSGLAACSKVPALGWAQIVAYMGFVEFAGGFADYRTGTPGDYGWKALTSSNPAEKVRKLQSELANGRLAMVAILAMLFQNGVTGTTGPEMWAGEAPKVGFALKEDRPSIALRALPKQLEGTGGPFSDSVWDPAGFMKNKTEEEILQLRAAELKHGRVAMLACLGWFHVAAGWHPIGDFASRTRVSDDPLINLSQLSLGGALQVFFTIMCLEWLTTFVCKPPAERPWDMLGWTPVIYDEEYKDWKESQLRELNNGRLAMFGIMGLIAQDLYTGDYFAGIAKPCFGNPACDFNGAFPVTPYDWPPLYPH